MTGDPERGVAWGDDEDIPDRHTTSRGGRVPVQRDIRRVSLNRIIENNLTIYSNCDCLL